jgi:uncharacterized protein (TIGR03086 family)
MSTAPLEAAVRTTRTILAGVRPEQLDMPTPCASWKVSDVINHVVGGQHFFTAGVTGQPPTGSGDFASGDYVAAFDAAAANCLAAFQADGAMAKELDLPFGRMSGEAFAGIAATDTFVHGWDLAKATGQPTDLAPDLAAGLLAGAQQFIQPSFRGEDGKAPFTAEQSAPAGASNADRLAAFLGRTI